MIFSSVKIQEKQKPNHIAAFFDEEKNHKKFTAAANPMEEMMKAAMGGAAGPTETERAKPPRIFGRLKSYSLEKGIQFWDSSFLGNLWIIFFFSISRLFAQNNNVLW